MAEKSIIKRLVEYYHGNKLSHAYLIETNDIEACYQDIKEFIKRINCPQEYQKNCEKCNFCNLLESGNLPSIIEINSLGKNIKKEQILDLKSRFSTMPTYTKENIYIIKESEKLNASSANTMLKFLEEPENNIIGFFLTKNQNNCLNTIKSRCEIIKSIYEEKDTSDILANQYLDTVISYLKNLSLENPTIMLNKEIILNNYNERSEIEEIFQLMLKIVQKSIKEKNKTNDQDFREKLSFLINKDIEKLVKLEKLLMKYNEELNYNVNIELFLDKFIIELSGKNE